MAAIIPRWEWRTFGAGLRAAENAFAALTPGPVEESDELYLLSAAEVATVFDALGVLAPPLTRDAYTLEQLLVELVEPSDAVWAVRVHKRRRRYTLGGCMAEVADLQVDGRGARTIAVESQDAAAVIAAVRGLGLGGRVNTSYPRGLATLVDAGPRRHAVIDVGTNSVKFHVGERGPDGSWRAIVDRAELTRLGEGLESHGASTWPGSAA